MKKELKIQVNASSQLSLDNKPLITVVITTYNRRELLPYAIQSVLNQTYTNYEIIVVNDCGEDIWDILQSLNSEKILYLSHIKNSGPHSARNTAIKAAKGEIICYLDDDDLFLSNHLETIIDAFNFSKAKFVYVNSYFVEEELIDNKRIELNRSEPYSKIDYMFSELLIENFIPINAWAHHISLFETAGYFDETLTTYEDWDMLIRLTMATEVIHINKTTVEVRSRKNLEDNRSSRGANIKYKNYKKIYNRYPSNDFNVLKQRQKKLYYRAKARHKLLKIFKIYRMSIHLFKYLIFFVREKFVIK